MTLICNILRPLNIKIFETGFYKILNFANKSSLTLERNFLSQNIIIPATFLTTKSNLHVNYEKSRINPESCNFYSTKPLVGEILKFDDSNEKITKEVIDAVNNQIMSGTTGRLFAVVHVLGKQFKITENDLILLQGDIAMGIGDKIILEKILLLGSKDFTLVGHPLLSKDLIRIEATVIEKTLSPVNTIFKMIPRANHKRMKFSRIQQTVLRINSINIKALSNPEVEGIDKRIF